LNINLTLDTATSSAKDQIQKLSITESETPLITFDSQFSDTYKYVPCLKNGAVLSLDMQNISRLELLAFSEKIKNFSAFVSLIMMMLIYSCISEVDKMTDVFILRYNHTDSHGQNIPSYAS